MRCHRIVYILSFLGILSISNDLFAQGINTPFGQNRIQYSRFEWSFLRSENYDAFFYTGGRELADFCIRNAENEMPILEKKLDHRLGGRIEIICYNTLSDQKQGNFGLEEITLNTGGFLNVVNNRFTVYFNGDHADLLRQVKNGLALVLLNEMLYGGSIQERLQTATLLNLPQWYLEGLTAYLSADWDADRDNRMKDYLKEKKKFRFNRFIHKDPAFAGHSLWKYLDEKYGNDVVANMVYITRLTRNYENAFQYVTNLEFKEILLDYVAYYKTTYEREASLIPPGTGEIGRAHV